MSYQQALWTPQTALYAPMAMEEVRELPYNGLVAAGSFSGCGGSALGLRMAGWDVRTAVEFVPAAVETYLANHPSAYVFDRDIRELRGEEILAAAGVERGQLDLWEGSPPCASFTPGGAGESGWGEVRKYSDTRQRTDDLFAEWARLLVEMQPRAFVAENVPGMLTGAALRAYAWGIASQMMDAGYGVSVRVLNAANYGTPQARRRLIFVGVRHDVGGQMGPGFPAPTTPEPHTLRQALAIVDPDDEDHAPFLEASSMVGLATGRTWMWKTGKMRKDHCCRCSSPLALHSYYREKVAKLSKAAGAKTTTRDVMVPYCRDGERAVEIKDYAQLEVPDLDRPCPTLTASDMAPADASVTHPLECRKFTPAEAKAICGFPQDFVLTGSRERRYERMGRAVMPPMYAAIGRMIAEIVGRR